MSAIEVRVRLGGGEVAKYLANLSQSRWRNAGGPPLGRGIVLTHVDMPTVRLLEDDDDAPFVLDTGTLDLLLMGEALDGVELQPAALAVAAIEHVNSELGGLATRASKLSVEVEYVTSEATP